jgi:UDP-galactopyranose mutase
MTQYDYVIVGAGMFGSVFAREATDAGRKCLIIDKRNHIAGNCHTSSCLPESGDKIHAHTYGPHIFHTNSEKIWNYVNKYCKFNNYVNRPKVNYKNNIYSFPINLFTLYQLWGVQTPDQARSKLESVRVKIENPANLEEWILSQVGGEIYETFIKGYTTKQWGRDPKSLPASIIKRLPIRLNFNDNYFEDRYQGIPENGYTAMFENLNKGVEVELNIDYFKNRGYFDRICKKVIFTGSIDEFYDYTFGELEWRSLRFENEIINSEDYQGNAVINFTEEKVPYTRITEHKHFNSCRNSKTIITKEYPQNWDRNKEKYYPVNDERNNELYFKYKSMQNESKFIFGGRLADYKYYDMHQVVGSALERSRKELL